jgi:hypothetical protein
VNPGAGLEILLLNPFDPLPTAPDGVEAPPLPTFITNPALIGILVPMLMFPVTIPPAPPPAPMPAPPEPPPATTRYGIVKAVAVIVKLTVTVVLA